MFKAKWILAISIAAAFFAMPARAENILKLDHVYSLVMDQNPQVQIYKAKIMAAHGNMLQQSLGPNPQAVMEVENFGGNDPRDGFEAAEYTLGIEQQLEMAGKRSKRKDVANFEKRQAEQEALGGIQAILAQAKAGYMRVAIAEERLRLAAKRTALADQTHATIKKRESAAKSAKIQHTKADIEQSAAAVEMRRAQSEIASARTALANLMGSDDIDYAVEGGFAVLPETPALEKIMTALEKTPMSVLSQLVIGQREAALSLAKANAVPDPTVGLGLRRFSEDDGSAFLASISIPIPVSDRNQGAIAEAKAHVMAAQSEDKKRRFDLEKQARDIWQAMATARQEVLSYRDGILPSARDALDQAKEGFDQGAFTFLDFLDAQRTLFETEDQYLESLALLYEANAQIDMLMGTHAQAAISSLQTHSNQEAQP